MELITPEEAASRLGCSWRTVYRMLRDGRLTRHTLYDESTGYTRAMVDADECAGSKRPPGWGTTGGRPAHRPDSEGDQLRGA